MEKKLILLTGGGRCGLDFLHSQITKSSSVLHLNGFNIFRTLYHLRKYKNQSNQILVDYLIQYIFLHKKNKNYSKRLLTKKKEIKEFSLNLLKFLNKNSKLNFEKKIYYSVIEAYTTIKKIDISKIQKIILVEKKIVYTDFFSNFFKDEVEKVILIIRNPNAAYAGQKLFYQNRSINFDKNLMIKHFYFIFLTAFYIYKKNKNKFYVIKNENLNNNISETIINTYKYLNINFSINDFSKKTFVNDREYFGESSYQNKNDLNKKLPENYYNLINVEKRWREVTNLNEIEFNEICLEQIFNYFNYSKNIKKSNFINKMKIFLRYKSKFNYKLYLKFFLVIFFPKLFLLVSHKFLTHEAFTIKNMIDKKYDIYE